VATVAAGEIITIQQTPAAGHRHPGGHGVVDGLTDRVRGARSVSRRLVRARQLLDTVRVLAGLGTVVVVRAEHVVQPDAVRDQSRPFGAGVRRRDRRGRRRRRRTRIPTVCAPVQIAYGQRRVVRLRARPPRQSPHDHHQHTAVQRHTH